MNNPDYSCHHPDLNPYEITAYEVTESGFRPSYKRACKNVSSQHSGFYHLSIPQRIEIIAQQCDLTPHQINSLWLKPSDMQPLADEAVENAIGMMSIPMGIATHMRVEDVDLLVPLCTEEPSVIAAVSHGAKIARCGGGFHTLSSRPISTGQIQIISQQPDDDGSRIDQILNHHRQHLEHKARELTASMARRGGGFCAMKWRWIPQIRSMMIHIDVDTVDAMGANTTNTLCESIAHDIGEFCSDTTLGLCILTNLALGRLTQVSCRIPVQALSSKSLAGYKVARSIENASQLSQHDVYRACTHNKGIANGLIGVGLATAQDTRSIEAAAHAYAAISQQNSYQPLSQWTVDSPSHHPEDGVLVGHMKVPLPIGVVGGTISSHPTAQTALQILKNPTARELAEITAAVGLAANLAALKALSTEGIQAGHMKLHHKKPRRVRAVIPAKVMLAGEYAVLFGGEALACTLSQKLTTTAIRRGSSQPRLVISSQHWSTPLECDLKALATSSTAPRTDPPFHALTTLMKYLYKYDQPQFNQILAHHTHSASSYDLNINSDIPLTAGLGSSSACALGVLVAFRKCADIRLDDPTLLKLACESQRQRQKGFGSGYDLITQFYGGAVISRSEHDQPKLVNQQTSQQFMNFLNANFSLYVQSSLTSPTHDLIAHMLKNPPSPHQNPPSHIQKICSSQQNLVSTLTRGVFDDDVIKKTKEARDELMARDEFDHLRMLICDLTKVDGFDQSFSIKTTGAGGHDALLCVGTAHERAIEILARHNYHRLETLFTTHMTQY